MTCPPTPLRAAIRFSCLTSALAAMLAISGCTLPHLRSPSNALNDNELSNALRALLCRVEPKCAEIRLHVTSSSGQQAEMFPDGRLLLNVGLLRATQDASEIAFILAHEAAHRRLRHQFARTLELRTRQEIEADANALTALASAGMDSSGGLRLLKRILDEAQHEDASSSEVSIKPRTSSPAKPSSSNSVNESLAQVTARVRALLHADAAHASPPADSVSEQDWQRLLAPYRINTN